jgi:hypothetical protein
MTRTKPVDLVFVLDATASTECVFEHMRDQVADVAAGFHQQNRQVLDSYAVVIYRDPVDNPREDVNEFLPLTDNLEAVEQYLRDVVSSGGRDDPEDWAGALDLALHSIVWRTGKKCIYWITDANAHGQKFSGDPRDAHNDQEARLERLIQEMAQKRIYFVGINVKKGTDPGCERTLNAARAIYDEAKGPSFQVENFELNWDRDQYGGNDWPTYVIDRFQETITGTLQRALRNLASGI